MCENKIIIRKMNENDFTAFRELIIDKMNSKYALYDEQYPTDDASLKGILAYFASSNEFLGVVLKDTDTLIGFGALNYVDDTTRNVGYCLHSMYWNKGYGTSLVDTLIKKAREMKNVKKLTAGTAEENVASRKILEKMGFVLIKKEEASFVKNSSNEPIMFTAYFFEKNLYTNE